MPNNKYFTSPLEANLRPVLQILKPCVEDEETLDLHGLSRTLKTAIKTAPSDVGNGWGRV